MWWTWEALVLVAVAFLWSSDPGVSALQFGDAKPPALLKEGELFTLDVLSENDSSTANVTIRAIVDESTDSEFGGEETVLGVMALEAAGLAAPRSSFVGLSLPQSGTYRITASVNGDGAIDADATLDYLVLVVLGELRVGNLYAQLPISEVALAHLATTLSFQVVNEDPSLLGSTTFTKIEKASDCNAQQGVRSFLELTDLEVHALIGPVCSSVARVVATIAAVFSVPQIGVFSGAPALSDKLLYPFYLRTLPVGGARENTMLLAPHIFGWTRVAYVGFADFSEASEDLGVQAQFLGIDIVMNEVVREGQTDFSAIVSRLRQNGVFVILTAVVDSTEAKEAGNFYRALLDAEMVGPGYSLISLSGASTFPICELPQEGRAKFSAVIGIDDFITVQRKDFVEKLDVACNATNHDEVLPEGLRGLDVFCTGINQRGEYKTFENEIPLNGNTGYAIDAVLAFAEAAHDVMYTRGLRFTQARLKESLFEGSFEGVTRRISFDANGESSPTTRIQVFTFLPDAPDDAPCIDKYVFEYTIRQTSHELRALPVYNFIDDPTNDYDYHFYNATHAGDFLFSGGRGVWHPGFGCGEGCGVPLNDGSGGMSAECVAHDDCRCLPGWLSAGASAGQCSVREGVAEDDSFPVGAVVGPVVALVLLGLVIGVVVHRKRQNETAHMRLQVREAQNWLINIQDVQLQKKLGEGAYGRVYKGLYKGATVAVKLMIREDQSVSSTYLSIPQSPTAHQRTSSTDKCSRKQVNNLASTQMNTLFFNSNFEEKSKAAKSSGGGGSAPNASSQVEQKRFESFKQEIAIMCALRHPCCVLLMGAYINQADSDIAIVSEFMERGSLMDLYGDETFDFSASVRKNFALDAVNGMAFLHASNVLHLDLKSANLLVDNRLRLKVSDFGLAVKKTTGKNDMMAGGTLIYMPPESFRFATPSTKTDVYAWGITMWEMYALSIAYIDRGRMYIADLRQYVNAGERPTEIVGMPEDWYALMTECWRQEAEARPDFDDMVARIEGWQVEQWGQTEPLSVLDFEEMWKPGVGMLPSEPTAVPDDVFKTSDVF